MRTDIRYVFCFLGALCGLGASVCRASFAAPPSTGAGTAAASASSRGVRAPDLVLPVALINAIAPLTDDQTKRISAIEDNLETQLKTEKASHNFFAETQSRQSAAGQIAAVLTPSQVSAVAAFRPALTMLLMTLQVTPRQLADLKMTPDQIKKLSDLATGYSAHLKTIEDARDQAQRDLNTQTRGQVSGVFTQTQLRALPAKPAASGR